MFWLAVRADGIGSDGVTVGPPLASAAPEAAPEGTPDPVPAVPAVPGEFPSTDGEGAIVDAGGVAAL